MIVKKGMKWIFNFLGVFYFGGVYEVMVKVVKKVIYVVLSSSDVIDEELIIVVIGVESLFNFRLFIY